MFNRQVKTILDALLFGTDREWKRCQRKYTVDITELIKDDAVQGVILSRLSKLDRFETLFKNHQFDLTTFRYHHMWALEYAWYISNPVAQTALEASGQYLGRKSCIVIPPSVLF
jgi:hypothetical protein